MNNDFSIEGTVDPTKGIIDIKTEFDNMVSHIIVDTQDQLIREGLIKLGWTPPREIVTSVGLAPDGSDC